MGHLGYKNVIFATNSNKIVICVKMCSEWDKYKVWLAACAADIILYYNLRYNEAHCVVVCNQWRSVLEAKNRNHF